MDNKAANEKTNETKDLQGKSIYELLNATKERMTIEQIKNTKVSYANYIETEPLLSLQGSKVKVLFLFNLTF
jgi:hypothetical protein